MNIPTTPPKGVRGSFQCLLGLWVCPVLRGLTGSTFAGTVPRILLVVVQGVAVDPPGVPEGSLPGPATAMGTRLRVGLGRGTWVIHPAPALVVVRLLAGPVAVGLLVAAPRAAGTR